MTVAELIEALSKYPRDADVLVTWEGTTNEPSVYQAKSGTILIDGDNEFYREEFENGGLPRK